MGCQGILLLLTASLLAGTGNSFETMDIRFENISNPWSPGARVVQPWLHRQPHSSERQAAFPFGRALPRYLLFYNPHQRNRWGHPRSYRIQHSSHAGRVLPHGWQEEKGVSWGRWVGGFPHHKDPSRGGRRHGQPHYLCTKAWQCRDLSLVAPHTLGSLSAPRHPQLSRSQSQLLQGDPRRDRSVHQSTWWQLPKGHWGAGCEHPGLTGAAPSPLPAHAPLCSQALGDPAGGP